MGVETICELYGISRQAHYQKMEREVVENEQGSIVLELVRQIRRRHPQMGSRKLLAKIQPMLAQEGFTVGRDRLFRLLKSQDLLVKAQKSYHRTTIPGAWRVPNLLPGMQIGHPTQVVVCDITYLEVEIGRFVYWFLIMDLYSRFILGWFVADSLGTAGALSSLQMALPYLPSSQPKIIHHSDHGVQYTSHAYLETLSTHHILPSMGMVGNCYDNIFAERLIGTLKREYAMHARFQDINQVNAAAREAVYFYNMDRPHLSLGMAVPHDVFYGKQPALHEVVVPLPESAL